MNRQDAHCRTPGCVCTHGGGCYRGWIDLMGEPLTTPCPTCRPDLYRRVRELPAPGMRDPSDLAKLRKARRDV